MRTIKLTSFALAVWLVLAPVAPVHGIDWYVEGDADGLLLKEDEDDGIDGNAELSLTIEWYHIDQEREKLTNPITTKTIQHNHDVSDLNMAGLGLMQELDTVECDEGDWIFATVALTERDMSNSVETVLIGAAGLTAGVVVGTFTAPYTGPLGGRVAGGLAGLATGQFLRWLGSGTDDLGSVKARKLEQGMNDIELTGKDGGGYIRIFDNSWQSSTVELECFPTAAKGVGVGNQDPVDPTTAVDGIFPHIESALAAVPLLTREDGTVDAEVLAAREAMTEALISGAEYAAVSAVYGARDGYLGASAALPLLASARVHRTNGDFDLAVVDYREAYRAAYTAIWEGNFAPAYTLADALTIVSPTRSVRPESYHEFTGWIQGLSPTETIDFIDIDGQDSGMEFFTFQGVERTAVILGADLPPDFQENQLLGLGRISGGTVSGPDANCDTPHLAEGSLGGGIFIDEVGPYAEPDPDGCEYGEVLEVGFEVANGGVPAGSSPDPFGFFTITLNLDDQLPLGTFDLTVTVNVFDSSDSSTRQMTAPIRLIYPRGEIFSDDFGSGTDDAWSATSP
jgi:hypothetical protein